MWFLDNICNILQCGIDKHKLAEFASCVDNLSFLICDTRLFLILLFKFSFCIVLLILKYELEFIETAFHSDIDQNIFSITRAFI